MTPALRACLDGPREVTEALQREAGRIIPYVFQPILDLRGAWAEACVAAGVPGRLLHDCRRTAVRNLERAGVSRSVGMSLTGHKTKAVFRRYAIVDFAVQTEAAALLDAHEGQQGTELGTVVHWRAARRS